VRCAQNREDRLRFQRDRRPQADIFGLRRVLQHTVGVIVSDHELS
jgi:hypothetical protein